MNIKLDIDVTPEEARRFLGLPDMAPVHAVFIARLEELVGKGPMPAEAEALMRGWISAGLEGLSAVQKAFWDTARAAGTGTDRG